MPSGLETILRNPRRFAQFASTPGQYSAALDYASQDSPARMGRRPASRTSSAKTPGTLETGEVIEQISLPDGSLVKPATESGRLVKAPGKSNLYLDPTTGEPYNADPSQPSGLRSAWQTATKKARDGKIYASISGVGEREIGPDPKVAEDATKAAAKREAENRRLALAREKRPYNIDRVTGEPIPLQTDEEWAAQKQAKAAKLDEAARVKRLKDQADVIDLEADRISLTAPKPAKEDEEAFTAAESALSQFAAGQDMEEAAAKYAAAPATDEASQQAKAAAENYLAYKDKVKPAKEAEKKVQELKLRALDIKEQIINPQKWKEGKTASLAALPDDALVAEVQAQADIINEQEEQAVGTLNFITKGRNKIVNEINAFQAERQVQATMGLSADEIAALDSRQAELEQALADYDEHNSEAKAESDAALKAAADRRDVLAVAGTELEGRAAKQAEAAGLAKAKAETMAKAKPLYEQWAKDLYAEDWRNESFPRLEQEAKKVGLDVEQAKESLQTYRQLDWSNPRRDPQTAKPIAEESRTLPDGNVTVNPTMWGDAEAYKKAVEASQGTPEGKAKALEGFPKLQEIHAEKAVEILSQSANIPGADNFMAWRERKIEEDQAQQGKLGFARQSPAKQAIAYMDEMKNRSWFRKAGEQVAMGLLAGFQDIATQALGVGGMVTGSETLADLAVANAGNTQSVVGAQSLEGSDTDYALRVMGMGARMTPAVAAMISGAGAVGGGLGTAAVLAGGQTAGSMFADLYRSAKDEAGLSHGEAWKKAALPAALAGTITGLLTKGMGATGLERVFSDTATQEAARNTFKAMLGQFVKGAAEELPEEIADEYFTTVLQESAASADPVATLKNFANTLPELAGVTALMGGAGALMQARRQAGTEGPGMAPPPEGEAPAMPVQPRPAGPASTPAPETPQEVTEQIAKFNPTGATPLPQSVAATAKRTGRPPAAVARQAASGVVKIAQGQSLESLDIEEQEALGFVNKGGKITPDTKVTPLVYLYKDKPVLRNAAAEWLTDEAQEGLADMVKLTEAERKAQIDAEEAAAKAKPAKKKAGQAPAAKAESTPQDSEVVITGGSLPSNAGASPAPATINPAETVAQAESERLAAEEQAIATQKVEEAASKAETEARKASYEAMKAQQPPAPAQEAPPEPAPAAKSNAELTPAEYKAKRKTETNPATWSPAIAEFEHKGIVANAIKQGLPVSLEAAKEYGMKPTGLSPAQAAKATPEQKARAKKAAKVKPPVEAGPEAAKPAQEPAPAPAEASQPVPAEVDWTEADFQKSAMLEYEARRTESPERLTEILAQSAGLPFEGRIATEVANRKIATDETFEAAVSNVEANKTVLPTYWQAIRAKRQAAPEASPAPASQEAGQAEAKATPQEHIQELVQRKYPTTNEWAASVPDEALVPVMKLIQDELDGLKQELKQANTKPEQVDILNRMKSWGGPQAFLFQRQVGREVTPPQPEAKQAAQPPRPATPEGRAEAVLAEYEATVRQSLVGKPDKAAKDLAGRKLDLAKRLRARLKAMTGAVDYDVYAKELRDKSGELEVKPVGRKGSILFINPAKLIDRLTTKHATTEAAREGMDTFILHEFIHKAAIGNMDGAKIIGLYNLLTPEAKAASKALYLSDSGLTDFWQDDKEFAAAHEWFAQLVEARLRGKISNQAEIEASQDPAFRDRLLALLRDFVAQLRDIAKLVTDKAQAARIEAEADAVQAIVADMAAKAGLELGRAEGGQQAEPSGDTERIKRAKWRELGGRVSIALPANASRMKPQPKDIAAAAEQLGINNADAALAWNIFTNDDAATPKRPAPAPPGVPEAARQADSPAGAEASQPEAARPAPPVTAEPGPAAPAKPQPMNMAGQVRPEKKSRALPKFTLPPQEPFKPSAERFAQFYRDYGIPEDAAVKNGKNLMAAIETGEWTNLLHPDNKRSRAIWEAWTRQKLPAGVKASEEAFSKFITNYHATSNPVADLTDEELGRELTRLEPLTRKPNASEATKARALAVAKEIAARQPSQAAQAPAEAPARQAEPEPASIGQENVNAKHSREWSEVSTEGTISNPRGTLRAAAIKSKTPSAPWYYQGDIRQLAFNQKAIVGGQSAATPEGAQTLKEYSAAVKDGWSYTNVKAGSYGTVFVFRKGDMVLTNAGAAALTSEAMARPEGVPESRGGNETNTVSRLAQYSAKLMEWLQTLPESTLNSPVALSTKMRNDVLAKWVRLREPDHKPYEWQLQYLKPDGKPDVQFFEPSLEKLIKKAINYAVIERDMPATERDRGYGYPEFKDAPTVAETLAANGFAKAASQPAQPSAPEAGQGGQVQPITGFDSARAFIGQLREGQVTAEQVRTAWAQLKAARPAILADLNKMKVDDLLPMAGISARKSDGKAAIAKNVLNTLDMYFNPDDSISYGFGGDFQANKDAAMDEKVAKWTDEMIVEQAKARREDAEARKAAREKALTNPETLDEWNRFVYAQGRKALTAEEVQKIKKMKSGRNEAVIRKGETLLTPEQLAAYDAVRGITRKEEAQSRTEAQARVYGVTSGVEADIIETKHTQKGHDLFVVKLSERVERPVYDRLNAAAKKLGGYYSSYAKGGAAPGFQFTSRAAAENFIAVSKGETVDQKEQIQERQEAKKSATAARLTAVAEALDAKADGILNADRKTNTAKRAREAAGQEANARKMQAMAQTMRNLAAAMESGEATHLDGVKAGTHVETLDGMARGAMLSWINAKNLGYTERQKAEAEGPTAEMMDAARIPYPYIDKSTILNMVETGRKTAGAKLLAERVAKIQMNEDDGRAVTLRRDDDLENFKELAQKVSERGRTFWEGIKWKYETYDRLKAMGLTNLPSLRAALREYLQYRGKAAKADPVKAMERELIGMKLPGFFPTPRPIIDEMIGLAGIRPGMKVLEPSAGKGDIAEAAQEAGAEVDAIELSTRLQDILKAKGINVIDSDFTSREPSAEYDAVVMNPPFENGQDIEHVKHAYKFLKEGGNLVAVMSAGPFYRQDKQATAFREWLDEQNSTYEAMPEGSFAGADAFRQTGVRTYLVTIRKPYTSMPKAADEAQPAGLGLPPGQPAVTAAQDAEYLAAVEAGDLAKAQAMVDEAAKALIESFPKSENTNDIPNLGSISADGGDYKEYGRRDVPTSLFSGKGKWAFYSASDHARVDKLTNSIADEGVKSPLIVVIDGHPDGVAYVMEGAHRLAAIEEAKLTEFPALVIYDKDAETVVRDDSGEIVPLSKRFAVNQRGDASTLRNPPAPEGGPAAEAEPGQTDADMEAFIAEQQAIAEEEAAAREALRNDPDAIDAVQASGKMSGRNLSKQFEYPEARAVYQALTAARDMLGGPETVQLDKLREWAKKTFESDPEKYVQWAADMAEDNKLLDVDEQAVLGQAFQFLTREARLTGDKNIRALLNKVGNYYLDTGTRLAQAMSARRDPLESPQERWTKALDIVFGPSEAVRRKLRILPTEAGKARRIASLEAQLAEVQGSRRADIEAALKTARAQETQEELLEKDDAESQKIKERVLKNIGVTEDDLMLSGTDRVALQSAILDLPAVKAGLEAYKGKDNDGYNIMRLAFRGFSDAHIANALNLNQDDVGQFIQAATNAIIRPAVAEQVKAGTGFGGLVKAGFARLKKAVGLGLPPKAIKDQPSLIKGTRQTVDDVTAEVNRVMKYALQSAKARNSGKLMSKVVMTPGGQKVRVFVPFDPDDMANYYAFAREYTAAKAGKFDKFYEYWINWPLLSGPQTQVANITGNAAQVAWHYTGQRFAEATLNLAYREPNSAQFREFKHVLKGFWQGIGPAFEMARQTFLTEGDTIRHKYLGEPLEIDVVDGDLDKVGNIRASVGGQAGRINRLPGRVLRFTDAFFKTAIMYAEASAVAYRRAHVEAKRQGLKGKARADFIDTEIANTLNDTSSAVWGDVMKTAEELLFQDENMATEIVDTVLGGYKGIRDLEKLLAEAEAKGDSELAAKLQKRIRSRKFVGSLMRWIFPFQRTPTNIVRAGIKKAGGSAISLLYGLTRAGWLAMGKDGVPMIKSYPKAMQIKDASETLLAGLGWLALASMLEGDDNDDEKPVLLVGTRSHSLKERAATDQFLRKYGGENSIVWQDGKGKVLGSLPFGRYEPAATMLTTWIDAYRNYQEVKRLKSQGENASYSTYMLSSLVSSLEDKSFLQGFSNAMQFIRDVEERRENPDENAGVKTLMNNVIPNLIKQPLRNMDDVLRERTTAGPGYAALPNPTVAPKLPAFAAQPKISTTGERLPKAFTPPVRLLFQANTKVTPQPDALLYRANRLHPTKRWSPQPLNRDDYTADPPGKAKPVPITDPAKRRQFAELAGRLYAAKAAQVAAKAMPSEKDAPGEGLIKAFKQAREDAMAAARKQAHAMGLHKATATP